MNFGPVDYSSRTSPPAAYRCTTCGVHGCKLWREHQSFSDDPEVICCDCAGASQGKDVSRIDDFGRIPFVLGKDQHGKDCVQWSDSIGWRVPAVPTEEGDTFWGYTSVPAAGVAWWKALPTRVARSR